MDRRTFLAGLASLPLLAVLPAPLPSDPARIAGNVICGFRVGSAAQPRKGEYAVVMHAWQRGGRQPLYEDDLLRILRAHRGLPRTS